MDFSNRVGAESQVGATVLVLEFEGEVVEGR